MQRRPPILSEELSTALRADSQAQANVPREIVGLDFDPFLNSQDPCENYEVGEIATHDRGYTVEVYSVCSGKRSQRPDVIGEVTRRDSSWVFTNFLYPAVESDLLTVLKKSRSVARD